MTQETDLQKRIRHLEDIEAIKAVKNSYWRCIDLKRWDEMLEIFADDLVFTYPQQGTRVEGKKAFVDRLSSWLGRAEVSTVHQGTPQVINMVSDDKATGRWSFYDIILDHEKKSALRGWGWYEDEYVRIGGRWLIKSFQANRLIVETTETTTKGIAHRDIAGPRQ